MRTHTISHIATSLGMVAGYALARSLRSEHLVPYSVLGGLAGTLLAEALNNKP